MALVGNPNSGAMALFNRLTGTRQEVANCAGVTVERKAGLARLPDGRSITIIDLPGAVGPAIPYSVAGWIGQMLQPPVAPIGFNRQIAIALVPGRAEREVAVGALGTVYALSAAGDAVADSLAPIIAQGWSLATADALLAW